MHSHIDELKERHAHLLQYFLESYTDMVNHMDDHLQTALADLAPLVFAKWYHTALTADTILSPANILTMDLKSNDTSAEYAYSLYLDKKKEGSAQYRFALRAYTLDTHPFIDDLRLITDFCLPDRQMDENLFFLDEDRTYLLENLSLKYDFYLEYLTRLAWWMGLFSHLPAIHVRKVRRSNICEAFFAQPNIEILKQLVDGACELAAERFSFSMDLEIGIANSAFFKDCLFNATETDTIFIDFYRQVDIDIEAIWGKSPQTLSDEDQTVASSFLFTGIMLDKWFLFPLSAFLRCIRPISFAPMRFYQLINNLSTLLVLEQNVGSEIFSPPTYYTLTPLGKAISTQPVMANDTYEMPSLLTYEEILFALEQEKKIRTVEETFLKTTIKEVYTLKVYPQEEKNLWKIVQVLPRIPLNDFCSDICASFQMDDVTDFVLTMPDANGYPMDFSPKESKRSVNKTTGKTLGKLNLTKNMVLTITPPTGKIDTLTLELLDITQGNPYIMYPRICRQSNDLIELERIGEIF